MKALKIALVLPWLLLATGLVWAQAQYGEATIEKGSMSIVRSGRTTTFDEIGRAIPVNEGDLIRVRGNSTVQLRSREKASMTLGSNAVFHVKQWRSRGKTGFLRSLFGRFRASVVSLVGGEQFNVKTATATIGVKGTEFVVQVTTRAGTVVVGIEDIVALAGQLGGEVQLPPDLVSVTLSINPATPPVQVPQEVLIELVQNLNSPEANTPEARLFAAQQALIDAGLFTEEELEEAFGDGEEGDDEDTDTPDVPDTGIDGNEGSGATQRGRVRLDFQ